MASVARASCRPQSAETLQGVVDLDGHRFLGEIAARANQRPRDGFHQQVVQRRVGQHHAEIRIARGNIRGNDCTHSRASGRRDRPQPATHSPQQENGRGGRQQLAGLVFRNQAASPHGVEAWETSGQKAGRGGVFSAANDRRRRHRSRPRGVESRRVPARPRPGPRPRASAAACNACVVLGLDPAVRIQETQLRPAMRASNRLGVKAAIGRVVILGLAGGAEGELGHGGPRPIVGQLADDRPPRAAIRAIRERIAIAPLVGSPISSRQASQVARSAGMVGRGERIARGRANLERGAGRGLGRDRRQFLDLDRVDPRLGRASLRSESRKSATLAAGPETSRRTASASFWTQPVRPRSRAVR